MARSINQLTDRFCRTVTKKGRHPDGNGLHLEVKKSGSKSWTLRFGLDGKKHDMGLGPYPEVSLAEAREKAMEYRKQRRAGKNPIELRRQARRRPTAHSRPLKECVLEYWNSHKAGWRNEKYGQDWLNSLETHAYPQLDDGDMLVSDIDTPAMLRVLSPIWDTKTETASRVRGRIESVLDFATTRGWRTGENPARWRGHLEHNLADKKKAVRKTHFAALPYIDAPAFMVRLRAEDSVAARSLEFAILNVSRTDEVVRAVWSEIDPRARTWTIPAVRMKAERDHRVPLSGAAWRVIEAMEGVRENEFIFPGRRGDGHLHEHAMRESLHRLLPDVECTVHGFRSTFTDWAAEQTNFPKEARDLALAHKIPDAVEEAYRRGDMFERRRQLAEAWARYLDRAPVVTAFPKEAVIG
jgi:integrase